jgi:tetratricopeptide (TPR) repeat protein
MRRLLLALFLFSSGVAYAQQPTITFPDPPTDPNKRAEMAEQYFNDAEAFYRVQDYEKAFLYYKQSYLLSLQATLLFNMGQCYRQMGKHEEALKSYKSFVRDDPGNKLRPQVEKLIEDEEKIIAEIKAKNPNPIIEPVKETDVDQDGIKDANDLCLNQKEDGKGKAPVDGCPDAPPIVVNPPKVEPKLDPTAKFLYLGAGGGAAIGGVFGIIAFSQGNAAKTEQQKAVPDQAARL